MLSDKAVREIRAKVQALLDVDPLFGKIDQALAERQTLRERNVRYSTELGAEKAETERLRMVLREHGLQDYTEVTAEAPEEQAERKSRIENALLMQARDLGDAIEIKALSYDEMMADFMVCPDPECGAPIGNTHCANGHKITMEMIP